MIVNSLYHPPYITFSKGNDGLLSLKHQFEGKELLRDYIPNTLIGLEYLWGNKVKLETMELDWDKMRMEADGGNTDDIMRHEPIFRKVIYTAEDKKVKKDVIN
jgi:stage V sporulation protein R